MRYDIHNEGYVTDIEVGGVETRFSRNSSTGRLDYKIYDYDPNGNSQWVAYNYTQSRSALDRGPRDRHQGEQVVLRLRHRGTCRPAYGQGRNQ